MTGAESCHLAVRRGLSGGGFVLLFQPIVDLRSRQPVAAEALLRWRAEGVLRSPPEFWHLVDSALAAEIGEFVVDSAFRQLAQWRASGGCRHLSVNVDPREIGWAWVELVLAALRRHGLPPSAVTLEFTETARVEAELAAGCASALVSEGVGVALDDAGTGYNALAAIREITLTELKIDGGFVRRIGDRRSDTVIRALLAVARDLGLRTVAEGVETEAQARWLEAEGADRAQGFLFSHPLPAAELAEFWQHARQAPPRPGTALIQHLLEEGRSPATVAAMLNRRAVPGPNGRRWRAQTVVRVLAPAAVVQSVAGHGHDVCRPPAG